MRLLILVTTIICVFISFLVNVSYHGDNSFVGYYTILGTFVLRYWLIFVVGFCISFFSFVITFPLSREHSLFKNYLSCFFETSACIAIGSFFAYVLLLLIAFVELNVFAIVIDINPKFLGITSDTKTIITTLKSFTSPPQIIASDSDNYQELLGVTTAITGTGNIYSSVILPSFPSLLALPIVQPSSSILLIDNNLIVTKINPSNLDLISPIVGNLLVQQYFPTRKIKSYPHVLILTQGQFAKIRSAEYADKLTKIDDQLNIIKTDISSLSASLQNDKNNISNDQNILSNSELQNTKQYDTCVNSGYYQSGKFYHYNTKEYCQAALNALENSPQPAQNDLSALQKRLSDDENLLESYQYYQKFFTVQKQVMEITKQNIPDELGVFVPNDTLQIVINNSSPHQTADFFETIAHEYLHYASYLPKKQFTASFFEEGFTEYFARQTIKDNLNANTNLAYPAYVKIITEMTKIIPESEFADIYFTKDQARLEKTLDRVYGDGFYTKNSILFETLQYTSDPAQLLQLTNTIMQHIGAKPVTSKDLESTLSSF